MNPITLSTKSIGRVSVGVKTPIIRPGDPLQDIVINSCLDAFGGFPENSVLAITEAVVAIAQGNFATPDDIRSDIARKFPDAENITLLFPIQSRNRFMNIPAAIAGMEQIQEINIVLQYPSDEVGNCLISEESLREANVNVLNDTFTASAFYERFGKPRHIFTGKDYIEEFEKACAGKANILLTNNPTDAWHMSNNVIVCTIREGKRQSHCNILKAFNEAKAIFGDCNSKFKVLTLADILDESINGSGYCPGYGLYGSNMMADGKLKLLPRDGQAFVESLQARIKNEYGVHVEVMIYGDGAFKDPVGGIWELADPVTTYGATAGLAGTPKEVKLKFLASKYPGKTDEELQQIITKERERRIAEDDVTNEASLGTTPRQKTDILASLADLTTGSGDQQTPVVCMLGFLK